MAEGPLPPDVGTIYEIPPRSAPYTITVGGKALNEYLGGWSANSVMVDNHSTQHVFLPEPGLYCPPLTVGKIVPLPSLGRVTAQFLVPPGLKDGVPIAGQICQLTYFAEDLPPNPGVPDGQVNTLSPQTLVSNVSTTANHTVNPSNLAVPAGTQSIGYLIRSDAGNDTPQHVTIQGAQTAQDYTNASPPSDIGGVNWFPYSATDTAVNVSLTGALLSPSSIDVLASPLALAVDVTNPMGNLLDVVITNPTDGSPIPIVPPTGTSAALQVSEQNSSPAPWQAAATSAPLKATPGALNTDFTIRAGVVGKVIWLHDTVTNTNAGASWEVDLWDGPSANGLKVADLFVAVITAVGVSPPANWDGKGRQLGSGNALVGTLATGPAGSTIFGAYGLSQV